jgi:hypothetical protein
LDTYDFIKKFFILKGMFVLEILGSVLIMVIVSWVYAIATQVPLDGTVQRRRPRPDFFKDLT